MPLTTSGTYCVPRTFVVEVAEVYAVLRVPVLSKPFHPGATTPVNSGVVVPAASGCTVWKSGRT